MQSTKNALYSTQSKSFFKFAKKLKKKKKKLSIESPILLDFVNPSQKPSEGLLVIAVKYKFYC